MSDNDYSTRLRLALRSFHHGLFIADVLAGGVRQTPAIALSLAATGWSYGG